MIIKSERKRKIGSCRGICEVCGEPIFKIIAFKSKRTWWHEDVDVDFEHMAIPRLVKDEG